jgi:hypothetical protein
MLEYVLFVNSITKDGRFHPSDLSDEEWEIIEPYILIPKQIEVENALIHIVKS